MTISSIIIPVIPKLKVSPIGFLTKVSIKRVTKTIIGTLLRF